MKVFMTIRRFIERHIVADDPAPEPLMPGILKRAVVRSSDSERELREVWSQAEHFPRLGRVSVQRAPEGSRLIATSPEQELAGTRVEGTEAIAEGALEVLEVHPGSVSLTWDGGLVDGIKG
jgi:hypothetical protein